jgi:hypothetical protein
VLRQVALRLEGKVAVAAGVRPEVGVGPGVEYTNQFWDEFHGQKFDQSFFSKLFSELSGFNKSAFCQLVS